LDVPLARGQVRRRVVGQDGDHADLAAGAGGTSEEAAEGEHGVVEMWRKDGESPQTVNGTADYASRIAESTLRLLTVTPWFFPNTGGVERHVLEIAGRLAERGVDVTVAAADNTGEQAEVEELERIVIRRFSARPRHRDYLVAPGMYGLIADGDWDLVHVQSWHTAVPPLAMLAALRGGKPYVITPHGGFATPPRRLIRPIQWRAVAPLIRRAEAVIALNEAQRTDLTNRLRLRPERVRLIPNGSDLVDGLDPAAVSRERARLGRPVLVSPGRLERFKGHHRVIDALPHLLAEYPEATLRILGDGPYKSRLLRQAGDLGVSDRIHIEFFPMDRRRELAAAMASADVGVLLSEYETQPVAVLELAAFGTPVVVAHTPGLRELAADGVARSIPLDAPPEEVARAIALALEEPPSRPPPHLPSWEMVTDELLELYDEVLRGRPPAA
jgi:glycosyltransferase involved in cell wall biosynthesis